VRDKTISIALLVTGEIAAMSLWFVSSAILPDMMREVPIPPFRQAMLSSSVQAGFVAGALISAIAGFADRFDPRRVFVLSAGTAALANLALLVLPIGGMAAIAMRFVTGAMLAGVYPVGMKIAVGWGIKDRGLLVGLLVGSLTLGSAAPHLAVMIGGAEWRYAVIITSVAAVFGGLLALGARLGPHHALATNFDPKAIKLAWTNKRIRLAYAGYLGHMWELFAMWTWIGVATAASYGVTMGRESSLSLATLTAFLAIGLGGIACIFAGYFADRIGKAEVTIVAMFVSGTAAIATALTFGGPAPVTFVIVMIWGIAVIPDSAQFSALVADAAPPDQTGSLMTLQTALGFTLTIATVQATPYLAARFGWPLILSGLAIGPALGVIAMVRHRQISG